MEKQKRKNSPYRPRRFWWFLFLSMIAAIPVYVGGGFILWYTWAGNQTQLFGDNTIYWSYIEWYMAMPPLIVVCGTGVMAIVQGVLLNRLYNVSLRRWLIMSTIGWIFGSIIFLNLFEILWLTDPSLQILRETYEQHIGASIHPEVIVNLAVVIVALAIMYSSMTMAQIGVLSQKFHYSWLWAFAIIPTLLLTIIGTFIAFFIGTAIGSVIAFPIAISLMARHEKSQEKLELSD